MHQRLSPSETRYIFIRHRQITKEICNCHPVALTYGRPFVSKFRHNIREVFCHLCTWDFLYCMSFYARDITIFYSCVRCTQKHTLKHAYMCSLQNPIYMQFKQVGVYAIKSTSLYKEHRIILSAINYFMYETLEI